MRLVFELPIDFWFAVLESVLVSGNKEMINILPHVEMEHADSKIDSVLVYR